MTSPALYRFARWAQAMPFLAAAAALLTLGHLTYVGVNLAAFLEPRHERLLLFAYPLAALAIAAIFYGRLRRPREAPALWLERRLGLGFRLINAERGIGGEAPDDILAAVALSRIWPRVSWRTWALGFSFPLLVILAHLAAPGLTLKFISNARSLWNIGMPDARISAPDWVLEGEAFPFTWTGEEEEGRLTVTMGGQRKETPLPPGNTFSLSPVTDDIEWSLDIHRGRAVRTLSGVVGVWRKPRLKSLKVTVVDPVGRVETASGVTAMGGWAGSRVTWSLDFGSNQVLAAVTGLPDGTGVSLQGSLALLSRSPLRAGEETWNLRVSNGRGQWSESPVVLTLSGRANAPPQVGLSPAPGDGQTPILHASDDFGLKHLRLFKSPGGEPLWKRDIDLRREWDETIAPPGGDWNLRPGEQATLVAEAEDALGLVAKSAPFVLRRAGAMERTEAGTARVDALQNQWSAVVENAGRLERAREEARLLSERGQLTAEKLASLQGLGETIRKQVGELSSALEAARKAQERQDQLMRDPEVSKRLKDLSEALKQLDEQTLRQIDAGNRSLMEQFSKQGLDPEALKRATEQMTAARVSSRLENLKAALESLRRAQTLEDLARLADGLYQKGEDLRSRSLREGQPAPWNRARPDMARELEDLGDAWKAKRDQAAPPGRDALTDALRKSVEKGLEQLGKELAQDATGQDGVSKLSSQTQAMDQLRRNLQALARSERGGDQEAWMEEARRQFAAALAASAHASAWMKGEALDPGAARDVKRLEAARHLAETQAWVEGSRRSLAAHLAPSMPHLLPQLDAWKEVESFLRGQARRLDPSLSTPGAAPGAEPEIFRQERGMCLDLAARLEALMKRTEEEGRDGKEGSPGMEGLSKAQSRLGRRAGEQLGEGKGTSAAQDAYLKELAMEQAMLRQMLGRMGQPQGAPNGESPGEGSRPGEQKNGGTRGEGEALLRELTEQMKKAEEALAMGGGGREKILATQKAIEANMLKATRGMKERKDEETEERESRGGTNMAPRPGDRAMGTRTANDGKWQSLDGAPETWAARMRAFMEAKRESPTAP